MKLTVTKIKEDGVNPKFELTIDGKCISTDLINYVFLYKISRKLTDTSNESGNGIFGAGYCEQRFHRNDTSVTVDFGNGWDVNKFTNPTLEIKRRVDLVQAAFNKVKETYKQSWTVES